MSSDIGVGGIVLRKITGRIAPSFLICNSSRNFSRFSSSSSYDYDYYYFNCYYYYFVFSRLFRFAQGRVFHQISKH